MGFQVNEHTLVYQGMKQLANKSTFKILVEIIKTICQQNLIEFSLLEFSWRGRMLPHQNIEGNSQFICVERLLLLLLFLTIPNAWLT